MARFGTGGRRILVTGAGGFVGRWLCAEFQARMSEGDSLTPTYRDKREANGVVLDLRCKAEVDALIADLRPTSVVHLAGLSAVGAVQRDPEAAWDVNLKGTHCLARAVLAYAPKARFIYVSSGEVYGGNARDDGVTDEAVTLAPRNLYAVTKAATDLLVGQMAHEGLRAVRFRPFNHTGPGQSTDFAVPSFAAQIARIEQGGAPPIIEVGNLEAQRDFCDVRDVVRAYVTCALGEGAPEVPVFNLASGRGRSIRSVLEELLAQARIPIDLKTDPKRVRAEHATPVSVDTTRAAAVLDWRPQIAWQTTLTDVLDYWRSQPLPANGPAGVVRAG